MSKLRVALLGGSFNPTTIAHMKMGSTIFSQSLVDKIIYVPCGIRSDKPELLSGEIRINFLDIDIRSHFQQIPKIINSENPNALESENMFLIDEFEVKTFKKIMPTSWLIQKYKLKFPGVDFKLVMGTDLMSSIKEWEDYDEILKYQDYIIFKRDHDFIDFSTLPRKHHLIFNETITDLSATNVRKLLKEGWENENLFGDKEFQEKLLQLVSKEVLDYILQNQLFRN